MLRPILTLSLLLSLLCACGKTDDAQTAGTTPADSSATATAPAAPAAPSPEAAPAAPADTSASGAPAPISSRGSAVADATAGGEAPAGSIEFNLPSGWQKQEPGSSMRLAQASIPGPGGPGEFALFYFGPGSGGSAEANISRWVGQMEGAQQPKPETFDSNGLRVTWVDVKGTLKPSQMGMGPSTAVSNARLYGAVVEGPNGPWFFKATGPDSTLGPQRDAFLTMIKSAKPRG